ncbi:hypothetical protein ACFWXO_21095 [Kitasatospora sp. NPDC059088]|uniref:hypothetical protein n=1 Tax=Kitasatospora sp. NPDC059088 TaxID=3346722 RepID=UPI0036A1266A
MHRLSRALRPLWRVPALLLADTVVAVAVTVPVLWAYGRNRLRRADLRNGERGRGRR